MKTVGKNIKKQRKNIGMTQEELAKKCGYTNSSMISKIESGLVDLTASKLMEIANILGCTAGDLMGLTTVDLDAEIMRVFSLLSDDQKKQAVDYLAFLANRG